MILVSTTFGVWDHVIFTYSHKIIRCSDQSGHRLGDIQEIDIYTYFHVPQKDFSGSFFRVRGGIKFQSIYWKLCI